MVEGDKERWAQWIDWSQLTASDSRFLSEFKSELSGLSSLRMIEPMGRRPFVTQEDALSITRMLRGCIALETLSVVCFQGLINETLLAHLGSSLRRLSIGGSESFLSISQIRLLGSLCRKLEYLHLTLDFFEGWEKEGTGVCFLSFYI